METAYSWAQQLAQGVLLPHSLENIQTRADLINKVNNQLSIYIYKQGY
jgi:hypothetical protein